ncbi:family 16 glycosylhydrolase [Kitasatospora sp. NPDC101176]|uniref:glycoside hydrolase family 16 protein n=1 Tax=Kitasatospora sp. NPDC101176 TaxID=3364099 RepID=UPI003818394F
MKLLKLAAASVAGAALCALVSPTALAARQGGTVPPWPLPSPGNGSWPFPGNLWSGWPPLFPSPSPSPSPATPTPAPSAAPSTTSPRPPSRPAPTGPTGLWELRFADDFDGTALDRTKWSYQSDAEADWSTTPLGTGNPGNQQLEFDQPANCAVAGGMLDITAKPDSVTSAAGKHYGWSSCMINTSPSYAFTYGYTEVRAKLPAPKGFWSALWTWSAPGVTLPAHGETDAFESYSDDHTRLYLSQHSPSRVQPEVPSWFTWPGATGSAPNTAGTVHRPAFDPAADFHTYGVDIEPWGTDWWIDGRKVHHTGSASNGPVNVLLSNFVYAKIPPEPGSQGHLAVDYVRAWQRPASFPVH